MEPHALFGIQFTLSLVAFGLIAAWSVWPRLVGQPRVLALAPLLWVHAFRMVGGVILAPGATDAQVPDAFRTVVGLGDILTAFLALVALVALRAHLRGAIGLVWLVLVVGTLDTTNAVIQSIADNVFSLPIGVNWLIVTTYVPALLVSSLLILVVLVRPDPGRQGTPGATP